MSSLFGNSSSTYCLIKGILKRAHMIDQIGKRISSAIRMSGVEAMLYSECILHFDAYVVFFV